MPLISVTNRPDRARLVSASETSAGPQAAALEAGPLPHGSAEPQGGARNPVPASGFAPPRPGTRTRNIQTGLETVIGDDERQAVQDATQDPWRRICQLDLIGPMGTFKGTGWLVGPASVLTAGHCVHYASFFGGWASSITLSAGRMRDQHPFGQVASTHFSSLDAWTSGQSADHDIACIHLDQPLGHATGLFRCAVWPDAALAGRQVNVSGYPVDKDFAKVQYHHANRILAVTDRRLFYEVDTVTGQSGAPVWVQDAPSDDPVCVGLHAYGVPGTPVDLHITANSAPRFDAEVMAVIAGWVAQDCLRLGLPVHPVGA